MQNGWNAKFFFFLGNFPKKERINNMEIEPSLVFLDSMIQMFLRLGFAKNSFVVRVRGMEKVQGGWSRNISGWL